jgi:hypothetical protein
MTQTHSDGETARAYLDSLRRGDLSALLVYAQIDTGVAGVGYEAQMVVVVRAPQPFAEAVSKLPDHDRRRIAEAALSKRTFDAYTATDIVVKVVGLCVQGSASAQR